MAMAYWNGMTWGVSNKEIAFLESLTTAFGIETKTNADKEGENSTEQVANTLIEFAMNTTYRVETGTRDIRGKIEAWKDLVGKAAPLIIGGAVFGPDKVQLQSVGVSNLQIDAKGVMRCVTLSFKFKEFVEEKNGVTTTTTKATTTAKVKTTAVNLQPSASDKASKKTVSISNSRRISGNMESFR